MKAAVLVNYSASHNKAKAKWLKIEKDVLEILPKDTQIITYRAPFKIGSCLRELLQSDGINCIISAGGDGSINYILNFLINNFERSAHKIYLGGIGLGSSNDFVKPITAMISGIPAKIDIRSARLWDIGKVSFINTDNKRVNRFFLINASLGVTADANLLFNRGDFVLNIIKSRFVSLAILYAACKTIVTYSNKTLCMTFSDQKREVNISNINIVKNPNISGCLKYDRIVMPDDGLLGLHYCFDMNCLELLSTLNDLQHQKFAGKPKRISLTVKDLSITSEKFLALETDGEVEIAKDIQFSVLPKFIHILEK